MHRVFAKSKLFSGLDQKSLEELSSASTTRSASRGEMIFYQGDPAPSFFIVAAGKVKIFKMSPDGKEQILMIANPGDSFAEAALFAGGLYPASAQALEDSELVAISRDRFVSLIGRNPDIAVNLIARLAALLHRMTSLIEELSLTDVTTRLAHYLVTRLDEQLQRTIKATPPTVTPATAAGHQHQTVNPNVIILQEKKSVLASQLGTIPETLSRSFARLSKDSVISIEGPTIRVLDPAKLRSLAGTD